MRLYGHAGVEKEVLLLLNAVSHFQGAQKRHFEVFAQQHLVLRTRLALIAPRHKHCHLALNRSLNPGQSLIGEKHLGGKWQVVWEGLMKLRANDGETALDPNSCLQHFDDVFVERGQDEH